MKKLLSKAAVCLLALTVILGMENLPAVTVSAAAAESTVVNVYDATTFGEMLKTENTDILLWQNINYTSQDLVLCNSIDLNGYNLTCSNTLTLGSGKRTFTILDSQYNSNSSNTATFSEGIHIDDGTLKIESGVISVCSHGIYGTGNVDFIGGNTTIKGGSGIQATSVTIYEGNVSVTGCQGDTGDQGNQGGIGGNGIQAANVTMYSGDLNV